MLMKRLLFGVVALLLLVTPVRKALAQYQVQPPLEYYDSLLQNYGSRLCLQPEREAALNGIAIVQQRCNGIDPFQRWFFWVKRLDYLQPGIYWVVNVGSGQCLDDRDGKTADSSPVQQWTCNTTSTTMQWKLETAGYPTYPPSPWAQFINIRSGKCLDVRGGSSAPGAALQIYHCTTSGTLASGRANLAQIFQWVGTKLRPEPAVKSSAQ